MKYTIVVCLLAVMAFVATEAYQVPEVSSISQEEMRLTIEKMQHKTSDLLEKIKDLIKKFQDGGRKVEELICKRVEQFLEKIDTKLHSVHPKSKFAQKIVEELEKLLGQAEEFLKKEIEKLHNREVELTFGEEDIETESIKDKAQELLKIIRELIKKAKEANRKFEVKILEKVEKMLLDIDTRLHQANPKTKLGKAIIEELEKILNGIEKFVEKQIKKLEPTN